MSARATRGAGNASAKAAAGRHPQVIEAVEAWFSGSAPVGGDQREAIAEKIWQAIVGEVDGLVWRRWMHLEAALLDAMRTGDVLFAASALRTMLSELTWLHTVDLTLDELRSHASSQDTTRIDKFVEAVWTMLGQPNREQMLIGNGFPKEPRSSLSNRAGKAKSALNAFVHPNYGSHVAAIYPEGREAAAVLLEGIAATYDSLLSLRMSASLPPVARAAQLPLDRNGLLHIFETSALPVAMDAIDRMSPVNPVDVLALSESLGRDATEDLSDPILAPIVFGLPRSADGGEGVQGYATWAGADVVDVLSLGMTRRSERDLAESFPGGVPERSDQRAWLAFNGASLTLAIGLAGYKKDSFRTQLLRQMIVGNPIGIWLCARALIENHAMALWLPAVLQDAMDAMTAAEDTSSSLPVAADAFAARLAEYLTTGTPTAGAARPWSNVESRSFTVTKAIKASFPDDDFWTKQYEFGSGVLHGRIMRNLEFAMDPTRFVDNGRAAGLMILARLQVEEIDTLAQGVVIEGRLRHGAGLQDDGSATPGTRWSWGWDGESLKGGQDYFGSGSIDDPYILAPHLFFHVASRKLACDTLGLDLHAEDFDQASFRVLEEHEGALYDVWRHDGEECWTRAPFEVGIEEAALLVSPSGQTPAVPSSGVA